MSLAVALYKPHQHGVSKLAPINPPPKTTPKKHLAGQSHSMRHAILLKEVFL